MNNHTPLEKLQQAALTPEQQTRLFGMIANTFKNAIDLRAPKNRPAGKAGLRAEKGYYRLLYLEGDFHTKVSLGEKTDSNVPIYDWDPMAELLRQLVDLPELQAEILAGIEAALAEVISQTPGAISETPYQS